ncbi:hypothetical protein M8C22_11580 [Bacillus spizizenii]|uniref:hypothetical protein n=1 Tax=Bacillus spizizenii TaxID=96241 RepID=UPI000772A761|nr:hypothetical protein [Bacillus spizizenii]KXJ36484.1 hypothetical protein AX282_04495 [Bacillus spizizenii]OPG92199.1 hypothetical protein B2I22_04250 [Bacillus spizizenii]
MKKWFLGLGALTLSFSLVACSSDSSSDNDKDSSKKAATNTENKENKENKQNDKKESAQKEEDPFEDGEDYFEGLGHVKELGIGYNEELDINGIDTPSKPINLGSMNLYIAGVDILEIKPDDDAKSLYFNDQDKVRAVVLNMKAENTSSKDVTFNPNQAVIVTDTGEQLESQMGLMGDVGGDFLGKVNKEGQTFWLLKDNTANISSLKVIIPPSHDAHNNEKLSDEKRIDLKIMSFKEAEKKYMQ